MHSHGLSIQCGLYTFFFYNVHQSQGKSSVVNKRFSFPEIQCVYQIIKLLIVHANQILKKKKKRNGTGKRWVSFPDTIQRDLRMLKKRLPNPCIGISDMIMETSWLINLFWSTNRCYPSSLDQSMPIDTVVRTSKKITCVC